MSKRFSTRSTASTSENKRHKKCIKDKTEQLKKNYKQSDKSDKLLSKANAIKTSICLHYWIPFCNDNNISIDDRYVVGCIGDRCNSIETGKPNNTRIREIQSSVHNCTRLKCQNSIDILTKLIQQSADFELFFDMPTTTTRNRILIKVKEYPSFHADLQPNFDTCRSTICERSYFDLGSGISIEVASIPLAVTRGGGIRKRTALSLWSCSSQRLSNRNGWIPCLMYCRTWVKKQKSPPHMLDIYLNYPSNLTTKPRIYFKSSREDNTEAGMELQFSTDLSIRSAIIDEDAEEEKDTTMQSSSTAYSSANSIDTTLKCDKNVSASSNDSVHSWNTSHSSVLTNPTDAGIFGGVNQFPNVSSSHIESNKGALVSDMPPNIAYAGAMDTSMDTSSSSGLMSGLLSGPMSIPMPAPMSAGLDGIDWLNMTEWKPIMRTFSGERNDAPINVAPDLPPIIDGDFTMSAVTTTADNYIASLPSQTGDNSGSQYSVLDSMSSPVIATANNTFSLPVLGDNPVIESPPHPTEELFRADGSIDEKMIARKMHDCIAESRISVQTSVDRFKQMLVALQKQQSILGKRDPDYMYRVLFQVLIADFSRFPDEKRCKKEKRFGTVMNAIAFEGEPAPLFFDAVKIYFPNLHLLLLHSPDSHQNKLALHTAAMRPNGNKTINYVFDALWRDETLIDLPTTVIQQSIRMPDMYNNTVLTYIIQFEHVDVLQRIQKWNILETYDWSWKAQNGTIDLLMRQFRKRKKQCFKHYPNTVEKQRLRDIHLRDECKCAQIMAIMEDIVSAYDDRLEEALRVEKEARKQMGSEFPLNQETIFSKLHM